MKNLIYKFKFIFSNKLEIIVGTFTKFTCILGTFVTLFSILDTLYKSNTHFDFMTKYIWQFILISFVISFFLSINWIPKISYKINGVDSFLTIKVGDIVKCKKSIIISTNTSFVTKMENEIISKSSVQGSFQLKYYNNCSEKLHEDMINSLINVKPKEELLKLNYFDKKYAIYDVGTVSKIRQKINKKERNVYFLALNDINSDGQNDKRSINDFYTAMNKLWLYIKKSGNTEEVAIHLIGSGHAGLKEITKEQSLKDIIDSYIGQNQNAKILTNLIIYIYPSDLKFIDIKAIKKYVRMKCELAQNNNFKIGNIENN